ncbi:MAG: hypothetical protein MJ185_02720 [Treponema sp.]|nr:hypothetical protein [Treponema sp.]
MEKYVEPKAYISPEMKKILEEGEEKKYSGYGYHGGGRPKKDEEARRKTISISGTPTEVEKLKELAEAAGKTVSRYIFDNLIK